MKRNEYVCEYEYVIDNTSFNYDIQHIFEFITANVCNADLHFSM